MKYLGSKNNVEVFALKVKINEKFFVDKQKKEKQFIYEPEKSLFE